VENNGIGNYIYNIKYDGISYPSAVIPEDATLQSNVEITLGNPETPYIFSTNSILREPSFNKNSGEMEIVLRAFPGHYNKTKIISPWKAETILLNGKRFEGSYETEEKDGIYIIELNYCQENALDKLELHFS
jgi:hypothetical protein